MAVTKLFSLQKCKKALSQPEILFKEFLKLF